MGKTILIDHIPEVGRTFGSIRYEPMLMEWEKVSDGISYRVTKYRWWPKSGFMRATIRALNLTTFVAGGMASSLEDLDEIATALLAEWTKSSQPQATAVIRNEPGPRMEKFYVSAPALKEWSNKLRASCPDEAAAMFVRNCRAEATFDRQGLFLTMIGERIEVVDGDDQKTVYVLCGKPPMPVREESLNFIGIAITDGEQSGDPIDISGMTYGRLVSYGHLHRSMPPTRGGEIGQVRSARKVRYDGLRAWLVEGTLYPYEFDPRIPGIGLAVVGRVITRDGPVGFVPRVVKQCEIDAICLTDSPCDPRARLLDSLDGITEGWE